MASEGEDDRGGASENLTRKILTLGLGAYFLTEDTVRRYVKDAKIPRDIARGIVQNATKGKDELYGFVARELSGFLKQMDLQAELDRFVRSHKIRVSAEIEFLPREEPLPPAPGAPGGAASISRPEVEWNVSVKKPTPPSGQGQVQPPLSTSSPPPEDDEHRP